MASTGNFGRLLQEAREEVTSDFRVVKKTRDGIKSRVESFDSDDDSAAVRDFPRDGDVSESDSEFDDWDAGKEIKSHITESDVDESIIHKVAEYMFDLFDCEMEVGYEDLEQFTDKAWPLFVEDSDEYTFEMKEMHQEFCRVFEKLCEAFIEREGLTIKEFYAAIEAALLMQTFHTDKEEAHEIVDVMHQVTSFTEWADEMRAVARRRTGKIF